MSARTTHAKMMAATSARFAMSAIAFSILCRDVNKTADAQPNDRVMTQGIEIGDGWTKKGEALAKTM